MKISFKKKPIYAVFLSLVFSTCFWIILDIDSIIAANGIQTQDVSDLSKYYKFYNTNSFDSLLAIDWSKGQIFYGIFYLFKVAGVSFELFLFIIINLYYITFAKLARNFLKTGNIYIVFLIYGTLTFWLVPAVSVALRQGFAMLLIALFLEIFDRKKNFLLKFLIIFIITGIHFSAIIFLPLVVFWSMLKRETLLLNSLFFITLTLYITNSWGFLSSQIVLLLIDMNMPLGALSSSSASHYIVGFSSYKMIAFLLPIILYRVPIYFGCSHNIEVISIYILFVYFSIIGMIFSGFPYHDRFFLYAWIFSPILIASFFKLFLIKK